jgi:TPR repeat protein
MVRALWVVAVVLNAASLVGVAARFDPKSPRELRVACALGSRDACALIGYQKLNGFSHAQDLDEGQRILREECEAGGGLACRFYGELHAGWRRGTPWEDEEKALATLHDRLLDEPRATVLLGRACDLGDFDACGYYGSRLIDGVGVRADRDRGLAALRKGCKGSKTGGCLSLADALREAGDEEGAAAAYRRLSSPRLPWGFWLWLGSLLGSFAVGVLALFVRRGEAAFRRRGTWVKVAAALAIVLFGLATFLIASHEGSNDRVMGWILLVPASLVAAGAALAWRGRFRAARPLLIVGGFLSLSPGLFAILAGREAGAALRAARAES